MRWLVVITALVCTLAFVACGGGDDGEGSSSESTESSSTTEATGPCSEVTEVEVEAFGEHEDKDFAADDYETNPPTGGDHNPNPLEGGTYYTDPPRLGEAVHLLEHGAVIGWTNNLEKTDQKAVQQAFNEVFQDGYYQLATVENPDLEVPFALSAWGVMQTCEEVDTSVIRPFIEENYAPAASGESQLACSGQARKLPPC